MALVTFVAPFVITRPEHLTVAFVFAVPWGVGMAFYYSLVTSTYFFLVPAGHEAQYSGLKGCARNVLAWLPTAAFSVLNEATGSLKWGFIVMAVMIVLGGALMASVDMRAGRALALAQGIGGREHKSPSGPDKRKSQKFEACAEGGGGARPPPSRGVR